jgi:outer membrane protein OmpA-like peptidoglycan-associated protein
MASILENLKGMLVPQVVNGVSSQLEEPAGVVQRGLEEGSAALLAGIGAKADQPGFMQQIFTFIKNPANDLAFAGVPAAAAAGGLGSQFLSTVFGSNQGAVADGIARETGMSTGKVTALLAMVAPLVLGMLGRTVQTTGMSATELGQSLKSEMPGLTSYLPAGLRSFFGRAPAMASMPAAVAGQMPKANRWLWPVVGLIALALIAMWIFHRTPTPTIPSIDTSGLGAFFSTKLPDGTELNIPQNGIENKLIIFLNDSSRPVDTTTWFNFDRLLFDSNSATLQPQSQEQLNNIVAIMKAYPNVQIKIGGYTDNTGDPAANQTLSENRAKNVMNGIATGGIDPSRLQSNGYGDQYPVADNSTPDGRAQNRRIALLVTQK